MALIKCKECGQEVSPKAESCPQCGATLKRKGTGCSTGCFTLIIIFVGLVWVSSLLPGSPKEKPKIPERSVAEQAKYKAEQTKNKAELEVMCRQSAICWGEKYAPAAAIRCQRPIEKLATYEYRWTDRFPTSKFSSYRWVRYEEKPDGKAIGYVGDKIQMQDALGEWHNQIYQCEYDIDTDVVLGVSVRSGKL